MIFTTQCPSCEATFPIDSAKVPDGGVYARCSQCEGVFLVEVPVGETAPAMAAPEAPPVVAPVDTPPVPEVVQPTIEEAPAPVAVEPEPVPPVVPDEPSVASAFAAAPPSEPAPQPVAPLTPVAAPASAPSFGKRDPNERAQRLARVLVSDMIAYHPDRHRNSLEAGSLKADFEEEIDRSWSEYVDQVGKDLAGSTPYFTEALNEILAKGASVF
jgi:predicted Zn finger-like uncharacterized protein